MTIPCNKNIAKLKNNQTIGITITLQHLLQSTKRKIIVYSQSIINAYSLLSHEWWTPLIKFMMGPTIYVREGSTYL